MLGGDSCTLDQRQQVALHAFAGNVCAGAFGARGDLVDLVEEDDAILFGDAQRLAGDAVAVEQLVGFFLDQRLVRVLDGGADALGAAAEGFRQHVRQVDHAEAGLARDLHAAERGRRIGDIDLDLLVVELPCPEFGAEALAGGGLRGGADQRVEHAFFCLGLRLALHVLAPAFAHHAYGDFDEIADDLFDVAADIADLGELGGFDFQEGGLRQTGKATRNFRFADAGGSDHQDVLRRHFFAQPVGELLAAPAIAQGEGDSALGLGLADNEAIELGDDFARGEFGHGFPEINQA